MANFLKNIWDKTKTAREKLWQVAGKPITALATGAASLVGLGGAAEMLFKKIDTDTQASILKAAARDGVAKSAKIKETVQAKTGENPTDAQVNAITDAVAKTAGVSSDVNKGLSLDLSLDTNSSSANSSSISTLLKKYWYLPAIALAIYVFNEMNKTKRKRRY